MQLLEHSLLFSRELSVLLASRPAAPLEEDMVVACKIPVQLSLPEYLTLPQGNH